jgi:phage/plasmid-like protein (TIGR03299 family)
MHPDEAMEAAHLTGWDIRLVRMVANEINLDLGVFPPLDVPENFAVVRTNPFDRAERDVLGVVGSKYEPFQNEALVDFLLTLTRESGAVIETAGSIKDGRAVFYSMKMPKSVLIGGRDLVHHYVSVLAGHDGAIGVQTVVSQIRVVCANTFNAALYSNSAASSIRHTASVYGQVERVRGLLGLTFAQLDGIDAQMELLIQKELTRTKFDEIVKDLWPLDPNAKTVRAANNQQRVLADLHSRLGSATMDGIEGTAYEGLMAITEHIDHAGPDSVKSATRAVLSATAQDRKHAAMARLLAV